LGADSSGALQQIDSFRAGWQIADLADHSAVAFPIFLFPSPITLKKVCKVCKVCICFDSQDFGHAYLEHFQHTLQTSSAKMTIRRGKQKPEG
jgi:hypothetical protein